MTIDFEDGFESGDTSLFDGETIGVGDTLTVGAGFRRNGTYGAEFTTDGSGGLEVAYVYKTVDYSELYARMYIYHDSDSGWANGEEVYFFRVLSVGDNLIAEIGITKVAGVMKWYAHVYHNGVGAYSTGSTVTTATYYCVQVHFKQETGAGANDGIWTISINGVADITMATIGNVEMGNIKKVCFGIGYISGTIACTLWGDDFAIGDATIACITVVTYHVLVRYINAVTGLQYELLIGTESYIEATLKAYASSQESHSLRVLGFHKA